MDQQKILKLQADWDPAVNVTAVDFARDLSAALTRSMDTFAPKRTPPTMRRRSVYWWSPELARQRKQCNHLRWVYQRKKRRGEDCQEERNTTKCAKFMLVNSIKRAKEGAWAELCALVDADRWGKSYRLVMS